MTGKLQVMVLFGGRSGEHEVSLQSSASVMEALDKNKYDILPIGITKEGRWLFGTDPRRVLAQGFTDDLVPVCLAADPTQPRLVSLAPTDQPIPALEKTIDVVFPVLHGTFGEDGTLQGLLDLASLPYVGGGVLGSAVGMDKILMKSVFAYHGLPQAKFLGYLRQDWEEEPQRILDEIETAIGYPCFVKPANMGSSVGISKAFTRKELTQALTEAAQYDRKLIVEENIKGREIEISVLGNDRPQASVPGEIIPCNEFYDYEAKYIDDDSELIIPAELPQELIARLQEMAIQVFQAVDCAGMARVDFFVTEEGNILVNEINTIPGFTQISMYPKLWEATGLAYGDLLDGLIQLALARQEEKNRNRYTFE